MQQIPHKLNPTVKFSYLCLLRQLASLAPNKSAAEESHCEEDILFSQHSLSKPCSACSMSMFTVTSFSRDTEAKLTPSWF